MGLVVDFKKIFSFSGLDSKISEDEGTFWNVSIYSVLILN